MWGLGIVDIVRRPLSPAQTAGWILLVVLLSLIGTLIYFLVRKPTEEEIIRAREARATLGERSPSVHQRLQVFTLEGGRIRRIEAYFDRAEALTAVGLSE